MVMLPIGRSYTSLNIKFALVDEIWDSKFESFRLLCVNGSNVSNLIHQIWDSSLCPR